MPPSKESNGLRALITDLISGDDQRAEAAARQLAPYGAQGLAEIEALLSAPAVDTRWWAVRALAEFPSEQIAALLIRALQDPDPAVRQCAALGCSQRPHARYVPALAAALADPDSLVARLAANALVAIGKAAVPALLERLENGPSPVQMEAIRALAIIGDPAAAPALFEALEGNSSLMAYWANEGLDRMGIGMIFFKP